MSGEPNVLLVVLDSARAKNCSLYGHANETTPFLESFAAAEATVYEQARAPGARSVTSHASLFSGLHVEEHGVVSAGHRLDPSVSVFSSLREAGYDTGVFTENDWLTAVDVGLKDGFDTIVGARNVPFPEGMNPHEFVSNEGQGQYSAFVRAALGSDEPFKSLANGVATKVQSDYKRFLPDSVRSSTPADVYVDAFLDWSERRDGPWAACVNLMDAHIPYEPTSEFDEWGGARARRLQSSFEDQKWSFNAGDRPWWQKRAVESLYDGAIRQLDAELERLVGALRERGELDDTLLVITSDHGEGFGEPSRLRPGVRVAEHGVAIHEVLFHVPLIVRQPGQTDPRRFEDPVSLTAFPDVVGGLGTAMPNLARSCRTSQSSRRPSASTNRYRSEPASTSTTSHPGWGRHGQCTNARVTSSTSIARRGEGRNNPRPGRTDGIQSIVGRPGARRIGVRRYRTTRRSRRRGGFRRAGQRDVRPIGRPGLRVDVPRRLTLVLPDQVEVPLHPGDERPVVGQRGLSHVVRDVRFLD
ncbi:sulfatase [Halomicroarcula sp. GCM10025710]